MYLCSNSPVRRSASKAPRALLALPVLACGLGGAMIAPFSLIPQMQEATLRLPPHCPTRKELIRILIESYPERASDVVAIVNAGDAARKSASTSATIDAAAAAPTPK